MKFAAPVDPEAAREAARRILSGRQYRSAPTPRPFRKPLNWLGDRLHGIVDWFGRVFSLVPWPFLLLLGLAVVILAIVFTVTKVRARSGSPDARRHASRIPGEESEDPDELERLADTAEREGRLDHALRLRFRAGLLRLGDRGAIRYRPSVTTNEVRRALGSESFDELARTFEAVAYGGQDASPPDVETARRTWPEVVANAGKASGA
jgi:Domain of unknown function (DUF4129)